jgi:hypothetical protein
MSSIGTHLTAMFDVSGGTWFLFCLISGIAVWLIRNSLASSITVIFIFPTVLFLALLVNHICLFNGLFDPKKMADWLIWTIMAATAGTLGGIGLAAAIAQFWDRDAKA